MSAENCGTCKYWRKTTNNGDLFNMGDCNKIMEKVTAEVDYGWDGGVVRTFNTEEDFTCSLHQPKEPTQEELK